MRPAVAAGIRQLWLAQHLHILAAEDLAGQVNAALSPLTHRGVACDGIARHFPPVGDWLAVGSLLSSKGLDASYDLILTAETIYNLRGANRLLECIKQVCLEPNCVEAWPGSGTVRRRRHLLQKPLNACAVVCSNAQLLLVFSCILALYCGGL